MTIARGLSCVRAGRNGQADTVWQYTIDPLSGALSPKASATVSGVNGPHGAAVSPDGKSTYVSSFNDNTVAQYSIDPLSGALSPKTPASVGGVNGPVRLSACGIPLSELRDAVLGPGSGGRLVPPEAKS